MCQVKNWLNCGKIFQKKRYQQLIEATVDDMYMRAQMFVNSEVGKKAQNRRILIATIAIAIKIS